MVFEPTDKTNCTIAQCIMNKMVVLKFIYIYIGTNSTTDIALYKLRV